MAFGTTLLLLQLAASSSAPADAKTLRDARAAQQRFELTRRAHLPRGSSASSHRCDAVIGRFCYWYDSTETTRPPEPPRITAARAELNAALDLAARALPANDWVAGQRVRYLMEGGHFDDAVRAARACRAERWWCDALEGLALHVAQRYVESDSAFGRALSAMAGPLRCEWTNLRHFTRGAISKELGRAPCDEREALARRLWQLGRPLWSTPGNDLATEHFARHTMAIILARSENAYGSAFGADSRELLLRYGWTEWFTRQEPNIYHLESPGVTGHDREPSYDFAPDIASLRGTPRVSRESWWLRNPAAVSRYAPRHVEWMGELRHQLARLPRGDSMLVAVALRGNDGAAARDTLEAALALWGNGGRDEPRVVAQSDGAPLFATVARDTAVASIEVVGRRGRRSERARYAVDPLPCSRWCLSDLVLFAARDSARDIPLEQAARNAIAEMPVSAAGPLGVYWEIEGASETPLAISLTIEPVLVSRLRRAAARLKLASEPTTVRLHWTEVADSARTSHSLSLRLPSSARGRLRVSLTIEPRGLAAQTSSRELEISPR